MLSVAANPIVDAPVFVANQAPVQTGPYTPRPEGTAGMNPYPAQGMNAAGTDEPINQDVAALIIFLLLGVWALRATGFKFVVAASAGVGG